MKRLIPLMQREWLQHRFGWALLLLVPLALALLLTTFGQVRIASGEVGHLGAALPAALAVGAIAVTMGTLFVILWLSSLVIVSGLARRDLADRSIEFWLSLPTSHSESLAAPLLVHLILVPAVALFAGLLGGYAISLVLVSRMAGFGAWLALPWGSIIPASGMLLLRLAVGLPLATLWLAPLILLVVLMTAWFRRWAWVILTVGMGLGGYLLKMVFGQPLLADVTTRLLKHAGQALVNGRGTDFVVSNPGDALGALQAVPAWAVSDLGMALRDLASPLLAGGLLFAAGCFALLVQWRQRGAGAAG